MSVSEPKGRCRVRKSTTGAAGVVLTAVALLAGGCGLFGGDDGSAAQNEQQLLAALGQNEALQAEITSLQEQLEASLSAIVDAEADEGDGGGDEAAAPDDAAPGADAAVAEAEADATQPPDDGAASTADDGEEDGEARADSTLVGADPSATLLSILPSPDGIAERLTSADGDDEACTVARHGPPEDDEEEESDEDARPVGYFQWAEALAAAVNRAENAQQPLGQVLEAYTAVVLARSQTEIAWAAMVTTCYAAMDYTDESEWQAALWLAMELPLHQLRISEAERRQQTLFTRWEALDRARRAGIYPDVPGFQGTPAPSEPAG